MDTSKRPFVLVWLDEPRLMDAADYMGAVAAGDAVGVLMVCVPMEYVVMPGTQVELMVLGALSKLVDEIDVVQSARLARNAKALAAGVEALARELSVLLPCGPVADQSVFDGMTEGHRVHSAAAASADPFADQVEALLGSIGVDKGSSEG